MLGQDLLSHINNIECYFESRGTDLQWDRCREEKAGRQIGGIADDIPVDRTAWSRAIITWKADISEERVRLRQHWSYFKQTIGQENLRT